MGKYSTYTEDEDTPQSRPEADPEVQATASKVIRRGWAAADEQKNANSAFAQRFKPDQEQVVVKFLEDDPYTSYRQHWIDRPGQKSFTCTAQMHPKGCPLCDTGDRPSSKYCFNVAILSPSEDPVVRSYEVGTRVIDSLKNFHQDPKMGPLSKHYWAISKTGQKQSTQTNHQLVKATDLVEDWEIDPLTEAQIAALKKQCYDYSIVSIPSYKQLQEVAAEELGRG